MALHSGHLGAEHVDEAAEIVKRLAIEKLRATRDNGGMVRKTATELRELLKMGGVKEPSFRKAELLDEVDSILDA